VRGVTSNSAHISLNDNLASAIHSLPWARTYATVSHSASSPNEWGLRFAIVGAKVAAEKN
jgi:hypothetical protein